PRAESYGLEAAQMLGVEPARVFKTLLADLDGDLVVGLVPVTTSLDLKAVAAAFGGKRASMAEVARVQRSTGFVPGGVAPVGQKRRLPTAVDNSVDRWETVLVSGGQRGLDVELRPDDLVRMTDALTHPIAR